jgi:16S rRNA G1207 methylase RsmC
VDRIVVNPPWGRQVPARGALAAEPSRLWAEARRVLRPGGRLHLVDFAGDDHRGLLSRLTRRHPRLHDNAGDRIPARMREVGLSDVSDLGPGRLGVRFYRATR